MQRVRENSIIQFDIQFYSSPSDILKREPSDMINSFIINRDIFY